MIALVLDTSTPAVTAGLVELTTDHPVSTLASRATVDARAHGELLTPHARDVLAEAGIGFDKLDAIVCGTGPGPFTGLRVGMVTAAAFGHALDLPVYGVCSLDAIAAGAPAGEPFLVATDARRREVYWASYDATGRRLAGPQVQLPAELAGQLAELSVTRAAGQGASLYAGVLGLPVLDHPYPTPAGLATVAAAAILAGDPPEPLVPLYLRRPDAVEPSARKKVSP